MMSWGLMEGHMMSWGLMEGHMMSWGLVDGMMSWGMEGKLDREACRLV